MRLPQRPHRILQLGICDLVIVCCRNILNLRLSQIELCLGNLNNRSQAKIISALREFECELGLSHQLLRYRYALIRSRGGNPGRANVALHLGRTVKFDNKTHEFINDAEEHYNEGVRP